jgi:hypothetical protein
MIEAGAPSTEEATLVHREVPAPPGVVMVSPPEVPRNAERTQCEGPRQGACKKRGRGQYKGRSSAESLTGVLEEPQ